MFARLLGKFRGNSFHDWINFAVSRYYRFKGIVYYRQVFGGFGKGSLLYEPSLLTHPQHIFIGEKVQIRQGVRLEAVACDDSYTPEFHIGNNVNIEQFVQISCIGKLTISDNVSIGSRTMILCGSHPFWDAKSEVKVGDRIAGKNAMVEICEGAFIGSGVSIAPNVRIGKRAVIGSNSVVKNSVPDFCVADGNPAVVVMKYDQSDRTWSSVKRRNKALGVNDSI
jgi:acetyltransferase-like isoleucine patch superfamily enzyme